MSLDVHFNGDSKNLRAAADKAQARIDRFERQTLGSLRNLNDKGLKVLGSGFISVAAGAAALGGAIDAAADFERYKLGLKAVLEEGQDFEAHVARLEKIAKNPGLGFEEALIGSTRLQAVGFKVQQTEAILREFANAVATTGGGKAELDRITVQLGQLAAKGKVLSQDLRPIIEASPAVAKALKSAFGTVAADDIATQVKDSNEFITRLLVEMEKLPRVAGASANTFENLKDSSRKALAQVGEPILKAIIPALEGLVSTLDEGEGGLKAFGETIGGVLKFLVDISPALAKFAAVYIAFKVAQKGLALSKSILAGVNSIKQSVLATNTETKAIQANTVAQRANAAARNQTAAASNRKKNFKAFRSQGLGADYSLALSKGLETSGKKSASVFSKAFLKGAAGKMSGGAGAIGIAFGGSLLTTMIPEGSKLGGETGTTIIDGLSGVLALGGPPGMLAALGLQLIKGGYAIGTQIAEAILEESDKAFGKVQKIEIRTDGYNAAIAAGDKTKAVAELQATLKRLQVIEKEGDEYTSAAAAGKIRTINFILAGIDRVIERKQTELAAEKKLAALRAATPVEHREGLSSNIRKERDLLEAQISGNKARTDALEYHKKLEAELLKIKKDGSVPANEQVALAQRFVRLREQAATALKKVKEEETERARIQKSVNDLMLQGVATYNKSLTEEKQLNKILAERKKLLEETGRSSTIDVLRSGAAAGKKGDLDTAEKLLKIGIKLQTLDNQANQLQSNQDALTERRKEFDLEQRILDAKAVGNEKAALAAQRELDLMKKTAEIQISQNREKAEAKALANKALDAQEKATVLDKKKTSNSNRSAFVIELKALELEAAGRKKEATALREKATLLSRAKDLQISLNISAQKAAELAQREATARKNIELPGQINQSSKDRSLGNKVTIGDKIKRGGIGDKIKRKIKLEKDLQKTNQDKSLSFLERQTNASEELLQAFRTLGVV